jgi:hypothetical protein
MFQKDVIDGGFSTSPLPWDRLTQIFCDHFIAIESPDPTDKKVGVRHALPLREIITN